MGHPVGIGLPSVRLWGMHDVDGMCKVKLSCGWVGVGVRGKRAGERRERRRVRVRVRQNCQNAEGNEGRNNRRSRGGQYHRRAWVVLTYLKFCHKLPISSDN